MATHRLWSNGHNNTVLGSFEFCISLILALDFGYFSLCLKSGIFSFIFLTFFLLIFLSRSFLSFFSFFFFFFWQLDLFFLYKEFIAIPKYSSLTRKNKKVIYVAGVLFFIIIIISFKSIYLFFPVTDKILPNCHCSGTMALVGCGCGFSTDYSEVPLKESHDIKFINASRKLKLK